MRRTIKSKNFKRAIGFLVLLIVLIGVIFVFAQPLLAPDPGLESKIEETNTKIDTESFDAAKQESGPEGVGENVLADSYLIYDEKTGKIIASRNSETPVAIASITKLMTAYSVQKHGHLGDIWAITSDGTLDINPILGLVPGDRVLVSDLINAMLIGSANDAAASLGGYLTSISKKPAVVIMNEEAKKLGMTSTHFENPIGFDSEQNYSTAADLKKLLTVIRPMALFQSIDRKQSDSFKSQTGKIYSIKATNTLLASDPEIHAIKTGYTDAAKGAMITAIKHEDREFIIIVLGSSNRESDTKLLKAQILKATLL